MARVKATRSGMLRPRKNTAMAKAATLALGHGVLVRPSIMKPISASEKREAVALLADDFLRDHSPELKIVPVPVNYGSTGRGNRAKWRFPRRKTADLRPGG